MKKTERKLSAVAALAVAILALSACGKNMNLSLKDKGVTGGAVGSDVGSDNKTGAGDANKDKKIIAQQGDAYPDTDGKLQPLSIYDMGDTESPILVPYLNKIEITGDDGKKVSVNSVTQIGDPAGISARSNLVFRAIKRVPKKELVESLGEFSVSLHDVRLFNAKGLDRKVLASQLLCLMDVSTAADKSRSCTGEKDESDASNINTPFFDSVKGMTKDFATQEVGTKLNDVQNPEGVLLGTDKGADIKLDLKKAFGLDGKKIEEQMDWIVNNTTLYSGDAAGPGYRKFRFVVANNIYVGSGLMVLQFNMKKDAKDVVEAAGDPTHGATDKQSALQAQIDAAKKAADDAATKKAADDAAAKKLADDEAAKKNAAPANLKYATSPLTLTKGVAMDTQTPTSEGGVITDCKSTTELPAGLALGSNCAISGTPTAVQAVTEYEITATNVGGKASTKISIAVVEPAATNTVTNTKVVQAPANLSYAGSPFSFTKGAAIAAQSPTATGDAITGCSSSPELPAGLVIGTDCVISGTPTAVQVASPYAITATNAGGTVIANISITIVEATAGSQTNTTDLGPVVTEHVDNKKSPTNENGVDITLALYDNDKLLKFAINKWDINSDNQARLSATAAKIEELAGGKVQVLLTGRTSITKPKLPMTNEKLAKNRAGAVAKILNDNAKSLQPKGQIKISTKIPTKSYCGEGKKNAECAHDRRVDLEIKFADSVRADEAGLADIRSKLAEAMKQIWDASGKVNKE